MVKAAALRVAGEVATHGLIGLIDKTLDEAAMHVAKRIHQNEINQKHGETDESV